MALTKVTYSMIDGEIANVMDFGADATGVANSSAAFAAAVATGKSVFVPSGTYKASFDLGNNQIIFGESSKNKSIIKPPAGATYCIRIDASTVPKQWCSIRDLHIWNVDAVANCVGILFKADNVSDINDQHSLMNLNITDFNRGIEVLGRQILCTYSNIEIIGSAVGMNVSTDPATPAFNANTFTACRFAGCTAEGLKIVGQNTSNNFIGCDFELCNTIDVAGVAAVYIEDSEQTSFIGCYWEDNGGGVAVDTVTLANNSIGIKFAGTYCYTPKIEQAFMVGSGILVWIAASVRGGVVENCRMNPLTNGFPLYVSVGLSGIDAPTFIFGSSNYYTGSVIILQDANGNYAGRIQQATSCYYMATTQAPDLIQASKWVVNPNGTTFTGVSTILNRIPGMELWVWNESLTNTFTINAALVYKGSGVIASQTGKRYIVGGFPANGRLIEI